jgi:hypothetical protein
VVHVESRDAVAERAERMPEAGRVRAAGHEAEDVTAGGKKVAPADVLLDPRAQRSGVHGVIVPP